AQKAATGRSEILEMARNRERAGGKSGGGDNPGAAHPHPGLFRPARHAGDRGRARRFAGWRRFRRRKSAHIFGRPPRGRDFQRSRKPRASPSQRKASKRVVLNSIDRLLPRRLPSRKAWPEQSNKGAPNQSLEIAHRLDYQPIRERQSLLWV